jgi:hypothetical protein
MRNHGCANFRRVQLAQVEPAQADGAHKLGVEAKERLEQGGFAAAARAVMATTSPGLTSRFALRNDGSACGLNER